MDTGGKFCVATGIKVGGCLGGGSSVGVTNEIEAVKDGVSTEVGCVVEGTDVGMWVRGRVVGN